MAKLVDATESKSDQETVPGKKFLNNFCVRALQFFHMYNWCVDAVFDGDYTSKINAGVAELADAADLKFASLRSVGSSPTTRTIHARYAFAWRCWRH